jgi:hypothetical protein
MYGQLGQRGQQGWFQQLNRTLTARPGRATPPPSSHHTHPAGYGRASNPGYADLGSGSAIRRVGRISGRTSARHYRLRGVVLESGVEPHADDREAAEDVQHREQLRDVRRRSEITEADAGDGNGTEVERVDPTSVFDNPIDHCSKARIPRALEPRILLVWVDQNESLACASPAPLFALPIAPSPQPVIDVACSAARS